MLDEKLLKYNKVKEFSRFPEAHQLDSNKDCYFSYHRAGCADLVWESDLFTIKDNKAILLGTISGKCCPSEEGEYGNSINASKKYPDKFVMLDNFKCETIDKYEDSKWGFIKEYWNKNINKYYDKP